MEYIIIVLEFALYSIFNFFPTIILLLLDIK